MLADRLRVAERMVKSRFIVLLLVLLCIADPLLAKELRCYKCGRNISGDAKYYQASDGRVYCEADFKKMQPHCYYCQRTISGQYYVDNGHNVCPACHEKHRVHCSKCRKAISGQYYKVNGKLMCPACYERSLPVCTCCGRRITGKYNQFYGGSISCLSCANNQLLARCVECYCPVNPDRAKRIDHFGGYLCEKHSNGAVVSNSLAQTLFRQARKNVVKALGAQMAVSSSQVTCKLVNKETLCKVSRVNSQAIRGFCQSLKRGFAVSHTIYVLAGMSREHTLAVMAHELTHAWMFENNPHIMQTPSVFNEGFCEWVAYRTTSVCGKPEELNRMLNNQASSDYSQGLRKFLNYEKSHGVQATIDLGKNGKRI